MPSYCFIQGMYILDDELPSQCGIEEKMERQRRKREICKKMKKLFFLKYQKYLYLYKNVDQMLRLLLNDHP